MFSICVLEVYHGIIDVSVRCEHIHHPYRCNGMVLRELQLPLLYCISGLAYKNVGRLHKMPPILYSFIRLLPPKHCCDKT